MMNRKIVALTLTVLLSLAPAARAMTILSFSHMNDDDEATYIANLVGGAAQMFKNQGHPEIADKVIALFHDPGPDGGVHNLAFNLKELNNENNHNAINPNNRAPLYEVEDALELTLKDKGINVPIAYLRSINKDFAPEGPPRRRVTSPPPSN